MEQSLVDDKTFASPTDLEERKCLEEKIYWTRLELQRTRSLSADADETICKLTAAARRAMQERDELRNQGEILLAELQARRKAHTMLAGRDLFKSAPPDAFGVHSYSRALLPGRCKPFAGMLQGRDADAGCSYRFAAASSGFGHKIAAAVPSSLHDLACSTQEDSFDPDMFLVDPSELPQDFAPNTSSSDLGDDMWRINEQVNLQTKGKSAQAVPEHVKNAGSIKVHSAASFKEQHSA
ncbi:uncharacterized protein LOC107303900 [Oryza brachyantha]|uniref:Uncharacterized protein n=1 Tax=Oryza brachyantha TaxID=4533 RepID=J3LMJ6_ORYBR|nr:uncharacterized protein LOC107303900 [Oryza brachyantha]